MAHRYRRLHAIVMVSLIVLSPNLLIYGQGSSNVTLIANVDDYAIGYNDCWGYTADDDREYALLGVKNGTSIIDITDNLNVHEVAFIPSSTSSWKDIKTYEDYAYVVNESGGGLQIIDLSDLPNSASLAGVYNGFSTSHNISIDEENGMLYAEGTFSVPIRAISLANPTNPVEVSTFGLECHDIQAENGIVYVSEGTRGSIGIYDLSTPSSPSLVSRFQIPSPGYVHNAWLAVSGNHLITTEETTGKTVKLWDISDPGNVTVTDTYLGPGNLAHNAHIKGNYAYISHYVDGLRIVDISDPNNIFEAGFYDTFVGGGGFNGAWGAFPFFVSGKILISDIQTGLYVVTFQPGQTPSVTVSTSPVNPPITIPASGSSFNVLVSLAVNGGVQTFDVWNVITAPNSNTFTTVGPVAVTLGPGNYGPITLTQNIPAGGPAGQYTYEFHVGTFPSGATNSSSFNFSKSTVSPGGSGTGTGLDWTSVVAQSGEPLGSDNWAEQLNNAESELPEGFVLEQNYPNPFNPSTTIQFQLPNPSVVDVTVYDLSGRVVRELLSAWRTTGSYSITWDGKDRDGRLAASGLYVYTIRAGDFMQSRKMVLTR